MKIHLQVRPHPTNASPVRPTPTVTAPGPVLLLLPAFTWLLLNLWNYIAADDDPPAEVNATEGNFVCVSCSYLGSSRLKEK